MVTIKMLGNYLDYEVGKEYQVDEATANRLSGLGVAVIVETTKKTKKGEGDGL